jgi:hypothetical protein
MSISYGEIEFKAGNKEKLVYHDRLVYKRLKKIALEWPIIPEDTDLLLLMAIKEHIDYVIVRDAVMDIK